MRADQLFAQRPISFSFEFFPPKTPAGAEALFETIRRLEPLKPSFVSVTYGAGGSTRELTHDLVVRIRQTTSLDAVPHLTCVGHKPEEIQDILQRYASAGVSNILALGGDPPRDNPNYDRAQDAFHHASDLVRFITAFNQQQSNQQQSNQQKRHPDPRGFGIGVAGFPEGHPTTPNRLTEMDNLKAKIDAGADYICTQLFFDNRDFFDFCERCEIAGIRVPIVAGIMPVATLAGMKRMAELALGARIPAALMRKVLAHAGDDAAIERIGIEWATEQCRDLLAHAVKGIHFYTLNKSGATLQIYRSLGLTPAAE
jgi:methylenetetrahydrofolate reductase (NADPH)